MNRVFFPQSAFDVWLGDGTVDLAGDELTILAEARRYKLTEAVRVLAEVTGEPDAHDLVGRVKPKSALEGTGAEILENSLLLGDNAYDIVPGWIGVPSGSFEEHAVSAERAEARALSGFPIPPKEPRRDEDLLAAYLLKAL